MSELTVDRVMTHCPHAIGHDQPLSTAHEMMRCYGIRHLPVLEGGKLAGMLSQRDLTAVDGLRVLSMQVAEQRATASVR